MFVIKLLLAYLAWSYLLNNQLLSIVLTIVTVGLDTLLAELWDNAKINLIIDILKNGIHVELGTKHVNEQDDRMVA